MRKDNFKFTVTQTQAKKNSSISNRLCCKKIIRTHWRCILYEWMEWEWPASHEQFLDHIPK